MYKKGGFIISALAQRYTPVTARRNGRSSKLLTRQAGFTIVELLVSIIFLGFVLVGMFDLFQSIDNVQRQNAYIQMANRAAQTEVETLRNSTYDQLVAGQAINFTSQIPTGLPQASGSVAVSAPMTGLKRVDVTVTYNTGTHLHTVTLSSLIGVIGISK